MLGAPCAYLDKIASDINNSMEIQEDVIGKLVDEYRRFQRVSGPFLFVIYSYLSCNLIIWFYSTALFWACSPDKVSI